MTTTKLDELLKIKKKGDASKEKKQTYVNEMLKLFEELGIVKETEEYFYKGFSFAGTMPLYEYLSKKDNKWDLYQEFIKCENFKKNRNITLKIMINLLACLINDPNFDRKILSDVILRVPMLTLTKDGSRGKGIDKIFIKYFLQEIKNDSNFPELKELNLTENNANKFLQVIRECINNYKPKKKADDEKLNKLTKWIGDNNFVNSHINNNNNENKKIVTSSENNNKYSNSSTNKKNRKNEWELSIRVIQQTIIQLENEKLSLIKQLNDLKHERSQDKVKLKNLMVEIEQQNEHRSLYLSNVSKLEYEITKLKTQVTKHEETIKTKDQEIEERKRLHKMISLDSEKKVQERFNRLKADFKHEYLDYLEGKELEMTLDLGENMRVQLETIFKILNKHGLNM